MSTHVHKHFSVIKTVQVERRIYWRSELLLLSQEGPCCTK